MPIQNSDAKQLSLFDSNQRHYSAHILIFMVAFLFFVMYLNHLQHNVVAILYGNVTV